jgi:hypothetical protein
VCWCGVRCRAGKQPAYAIRALRAKALALGGRKPPAALTPSVSAATRVPGLRGRNAAQPTLRYGVAFLSRGTPARAIQ